MFEKLAEPSVQRIAGIMPYSNMQKPLNDRLSFTFSENSGIPEQKFCDKIYSELFAVNGEVATSGDDFLVSLGGDGGVGNKLDRTPSKTEGGTAGRIAPLPFNFDSVSG